MPVDDRGCPRCWWKNPLPKVIRADDLIVYAGGGGPRRPPVATSLGFQQPANTVTPVTFTGVQCHAGDWLFVTTMCKATIDWDQHFTWSADPISTSHLMQECSFSGVDSGPLIRAYGMRVATAGNGSIVITEGGVLAPEDRVISVVNVSGTADRPISGVQNSFQAENISGYPYVFTPIQANPGPCDFGVFYHPMMDPKSTPTSEWINATPLDRDGTSVYTLEIATTLAPSGVFSFQISSAGVGSYGVLGLCVKGV
jgi:hypothetical protein